MLIRTALNLVSPAHERARLSILIFHRVLPEPDPLMPEEMHARQFDAICGWLKDWFNVLPLDLAVNQLRHGTLPARACAITFDDGYADNLHIASPILKKYGLCATFFIATAFLNGGRMWNDTVIETIRRSLLGQVNVPGLGEYSLDGVMARRQAIRAVIDKIKYLPVDERQAMTLQLAAQAQAEPPDDLMMVTDDLRRMRTLGMQIGAHTVSHPILARLSADAARREMQDGHRWLQDVLAERVSLFAYPNGKPGADYLPEHAEMARELGVAAAVTTTWGAARTQTNPFELPRFTPWDHSRSRFGARLIHNLAIR